MYTDLLLELRQGDVCVGRDEQGGDVVEPAANSYRVGRATLGLGPSAADEGIARAGWGITLAVRRVIPCRFDDTQGPEGVERGLGRGFTARGDGAAALNHPLQGSEALRDAMTWGIRWSSRRVRRRSRSWYRPLPCSVVSGGRFVSRSLTRRGANVGLHRCPGDRRPRLHLTHDDPHLRVRHHRRLPWFEDTGGYRRWWRSASGRAELVVAGSQISCRWPRGGRAQVVVG